MHIVHANIVTPEMKQLWNESYTIFNLRYEDVFSFEEENIAEEAWNHYANLFEAANQPVCVCGEKLEASWCVWYCCCPGEPYSWYCNKCHKSWYSTGSGNLEEETFD